MLSNAQHKAVLWSVQGGKCWLCQEKIDKPQTNNRKLLLSFDHVIPRSHGGPHDRWNKLAAHALCNSIRQNNPPTTTQANAGLFYIDQLTDWLNDNHEHFHDFGVSRSAVVRYLRSVVDAATPWSCLPQSGRTR